jgi:site-specific DNA-cytosine methylase
VTTEHAPKIVTGLVYRTAADRSRGGERGLEVGGEKANSLTGRPDKSSLLCVGHAEGINHEQQSRVYSPLGKSPTLLANSGGGGYDKQPKVAVDKVYYRKLTVKECERLQTVPDGYTDGVSKSQAYRMLGNGWTVEVIAHIFRFLPGGKKGKPA